MTLPFNLGDLMKQMKDMPEFLKNAQATMAEKRITAEAGAGMVSITMNGLYQVTAIEIEDSAVEELQKDKSVLQDLLISAFNTAKNKVDEDNKNSILKK